MKTVFNKIIFAFLGLTLVVVACKKDAGGDATNPPETNTQEQITTVILLGYNKNDSTNASQQFQVTWQDLDGSGGNGPYQDSLMLDTGVEYLVSVLLLDKTKTPWDTISNEVEEKKDVHQFFYTPSASLTQKMSITVLDYDDHTPALSVGLHFSIDTRNAFSFGLPVEGELRMVLSHYDGVPKTNAPSPESDIDIVFAVRLK